MLICCGLIAFSLPFTLSANRTQATYINLVLGILSQSMCIGWTQELLRSCNNMSSAPPNQPKK